MANLTKLTSLYLRNNRLKTIPRMPNTRNIDDFDVSNDDGNDWSLDIELMGKTEIEIKNIVFG